MSADVKAIERRYTRLQSLQSTYLPLWQELAALILPRKRGVGQLLSPGAKQTQGLFDSTAIHANEMLAASMQGALTSAVIRWFRLRMRANDLNDVAPIALWLEQCADIMYTALQQSNFNAELQELYLDLGALGTGALFMDEREEPPIPNFRGFRFQALAVGDYLIGEGPEGWVDTVFRVYELSAEACQRKFGKAYLTDTLKKIIETEPDKPLRILHAVFPRQRNVLGAWVPAVRKPYASVHIWWDGSEKVLLRESGYDGFPFLVPRWTKVTGEIYGRGPGHTALPDVKTLNRAKELELAAYALAVRPPLKQRDAGVIGQVKWTPAGITSVRDMDAIDVMKSGTQWDAVQIKSQELRTSIQEIFFNSQLQFPSNQPMTATEIERRYELMQRVLGPTLGRLESELLGRLIERAFHMMLLRQALPEPPTELIAATQSGRGNIDVTYEGPLARSQKSADAVAVQRTYQVAAPIAEVVPEALDNLDHDENIRTLARSSGLPERGLRSKDAVNAIRQQRQEKQAQADAQAQIAHMAETAQKAAPLIKALAPGGVTQPAPATAPPEVSNPEQVTA